VRRAAAIAVALPWVAWALVRWLGLDGRYPVVAAIAYTPYVALTSPLPVVIALVLRRRVVALVAALAGAALVLAVAPRALAGPRPAARGPALTVMTANLFRGRADAAAVVRTARAHGVQVLALEELTPGEVARLDAAGLGRLFPYRLHGSENELFSRAPLRDRSGDAATLRLAGAPPVRVRVVHPLPPLNRPWARDWRAAIRALPGADSRGDVQLLAGDFNATLDHEAMRALLARGYVDAADAAGDGLTWTWPALGHPHTPPITIDHVLVDRRVRALGVTAVGIPGTDHRAVVARLRLPRG
jgi:endonuclease/exonuclease/phosphatase family metal-dependent hydrolase